MVIIRFQLLLMGIFALLSFRAVAQNTGVYHIYDSTIISSKGQAQQNEFMNNSYNFPAKPRNEMEFGISGGLFAISGDVSAEIPTLGFGAHFRKALGYVFSLRLQYNYGMAKGLNWKGSDGWHNNPAWILNGYIPGSPVYYNYKSTVQDLSLQGIFTLNNIRFHKQKTSMVIYGGVGAGATIYDTRVNALNGNTPYNFSSVSAAGYTNRKDIRNQLKDMMDETYETDAQNNGKNRAKLFGQSLRPTGHIIAGIAFKLSRRVNLALENKFTVTKDDLLDGQQYQDGVQGALTGDFDSYNYSSVGLNFNFGKKAIEPLWWINPLDYAYSEINNPKHMKLPKPVFDDEDGDGVVDQLDKCAGTPAGVKVDTQGCPLDTDGDGVPDYLDKELITPTICQPVDSDGIGKCPDPECCKDIVKAASCNIGDLPGISFRGNANILSNDSKAMLATVASKLKQNADCTISLIGYSTAWKTSQAMCHRRLNAIKAYLVEVEGISGDRVRVSCQIGSGDTNTVDIKSN